MSAQKERELTFTGHQHQISIQNVHNYEHPPMIEANLLMISSIHSAVQGLHEKADVILGKDCIILEKDCQIHLQNCQIQMQKQFIDHLRADIARKEEEIKQLKLLVNQGPSIQNVIHGHDGVGMYIP